MVDRPRSEERPVLAGLLALGGVAVVVGILAGVMVLVGTTMLGLGGGDDDTTASDRGGETLTLPEFSQLESPSGPQITLDVGPTPSGSAPASPEQAESETVAPEKAITLNAGQTAVGAMQQIDLSGTYVQGGGAILQVQRFENGAWTNFPVTVSVNGESFGTYVMTGQTGENKFRVVDSESGLESNEVVVQVG